MKLNRSSAIFFFAIIAVTAILKILLAANIEWSGFSTVTAIALFAGLSFKDKGKAFLLPLICVFVSDVIVQIFYAMNWFSFRGFYSWQILNYSLFILITLLGSLLRKGKTAGVITAILAGPTLFFLISNFFVWKMQGSIMSYSNDMSGLMKCYVAGLPFYRNSLIATAIFLPAFIASYNMMVKGKFSLRLLAE